MNEPLLMPKGVDTRDLMNDRRGIMKKICFAIAVHENKEVITDLLENIRFFCPNSSIVLYNGGHDPNLCNGLGCPVCPTSTPLLWGNLVSFFLHVMEWLEGMNYEYDYLINLDSDALFAKKGYEEFIHSEMQDFDYMAAYLREPDPNWYPRQTMHSQWYRWDPIFNIPHIKACFNNGQVFSKKFVRNLLNFGKLDQIKSSLLENRVFALEEMVFASLAETVGMRSKSYPVHVQAWNRYRPHFSQWEINSGIENQMDCYLIHPVSRYMHDGARVYIRSLMNKK